MDLNNGHHRHHEHQRTGLVRFGIGGPVGSGKSHLLLRLCQALGGDHSIIAITNDIYSREDADFLIRAGALGDGRIVGVETGGCPHAAVRDDISLNADALERLQERFADAGMAFIESGGDNLAASFSPDLVDYQIPDLRHRRSPGWRHPAQGWTGDNPQRPAGGQQGGPGSLRRGGSGADGGRRARRTRRPAVRDHQSENAAPASRGVARQRRPVWHRPPGRCCSTRTR